MSDKDIKTCDECGASVYPEHLADGKAKLIDGKLYCPYCLADYQKSHHVDEVRFIGQSTMKAPGEEDLPSIAVDLSGGSPSATQIQAIGGDTLAGAAMAHHDDSRYVRTLDSKNPAATRCRTFHSRLNDGAIAFMNNQINEWIDASPDVYVKFATSTIGTFEGKKAEPALIVTVFY